MQNIFKKRKNKILIPLFILLLFLCIFIYKNGTRNESSPPLELNKTEYPIENKKNNTATLEINGTKYESEINSGTTIYEFMKKIEAEGKISFKEKNYIGMGKFVEEINGIKTNDEKYWIYYVNNVKANIGISNYKINQGDIVSWRYQSEY